MPYSRINKPRKLKKVDKFLVVSSSVRRWLARVTLVGLILASSILTLPQITPVTINPSNPLLLSASDSSSITTGTYTQFVRNQMQWKASPVKDVDGNEASAVRTIEAVQVNQSLKPNNNKTQPVKVATTSKQQVSRSASSELVNNALSLQGVPYVYGGTSTKGFDCSGYTQYVFKGSGSSLPRTSYEQYKSGASVTRENLEMGDLVFFTTYSAGASHVGIYIGGGSFIHASNSGVRKTTLSDSYYADRYVGARRVN